MTVDRATLQSYVGSYRNEDAGVAISFALNGDQLTFIPPAGTGAMTLAAISPTSFRVVEREGLVINFEGRGGMIERAVAVLNNTPQVWTRVAASPAGAAAAPPPAPAAAPTAAPAADTKPAARTAARNWPGFRGDNAAGNGDGQGAVVEWDVDTQQNIRWKTAIPGISNASPVVWGNRVFVVTAVSSAGDKTFRTGLYGDVAPVNDLSEHTWKIYSLDKATGKILWERDAFKGAPKVKRHTKASQANSTPVTDGRRVVAMFGSIGMLAAWDMDGKPLWQIDIGVLDSGWFFDPDTQWGHSSSPLMHDGKVIVQADRQKDSFIAAFDAATGKERWRTARDEISTWGTPTVFRAGAREQIVTNGPKIRGYDPATGKLLWTLGPNSEVTVGTPVVGNGVVYRHWRVSPGAARLRDQAERQRRDLAAQGQVVQRGHRLEQWRRDLHPDADLLQRRALHLRQQRRRHRLRRRDRRAPLPRARWWRRLVLGVASRRRRPAVFRERGRGRLRGARRPHLPGDREERDEGSDHVHAGDLGRRHGRADAGARLRDRAEVAFAPFTRGIRVLSAANWVTRWPVSFYRR